MVVSADEVRSMRKAWATFVEGRPVPADVRPEIIASWRRSQLSQVSVDGLHLPFTPLAMEDSRLLLAAEPVLDRFADSVAGSPVSVILADRTGRVVARWSGETALERRLEAESISLGFVLSEEHAGTNGIGTALETMRPVKVCGPEHYAKSLHALTCAGAPLRNPLSRQIDGVVNLACPNAEVNGLLLPTVIDLARRIGREMHARSTHREQAVLDAFLLANRTVRGPIVAVSESFMMANPAATSVLGGVARSALWEQVPERLGESALSGTIQLDHETLPATFRGVVVEGRTVGSVIVFASDPSVRHPWLAEPPDGAISRLRAAGLAGCSPAWQHICRTAVQLQPDRPVAIVGEPGIGKRALAEFLHRHHGTGDLRLLPASLELVDGPQHWLQILYESLSDAAVGTLVILQAQELSPRCARAASELIGASPGDRLVVATVTTSTTDPGGASLVTGLNDLQTIVLPPLRERIADLHALAEHRLAMAGSHGPPPRLSADAASALARHAWPGNVRELNAAIGAALARRRGSVLTSVDLPASVLSAGRTGLSRIEAIERAAIQQALVESGGNKSAAAAALGMSRKTFHRRIHRYRLGDNGGFPAGPTG
ncbi:MAG: sigma-54-dependent Fis family transcriptional regulator [Pseudonocardia sp.]